MNRSLHLFWALVLVITAGCGAENLSKESMGAEQATLHSGLYGEADVSPAAAERPSAAPLTHGSHNAIRPMIILTGQLIVEVEDFRRAAEQFRQALDGLGGTLSSSHEEVDAAGRRYGTLSMRVPTARWNDALEAARSLGEVKEESTTAQDVGEEYYDVEARLTAHRKMESELMTLLNANRRGKLSDLLEIERELARVRAEIESKQGRLRYLANQVDFSTLTVGLREPSALVEMEPGAFDPIWESIGDAARNFSHSVGTIISMAAVLLPWLLVAGGTFLVLRRARRKRKAE